MLMPVPRVDLVGFVVRGVEVTVTSAGPTHMLISVNVLVGTDVRAPSPNGLTVALKQMIPNPSTKEAERDAIRRVVLNALAHEVDEWLRVNGERVDPHA